MANMLKAFIPFPAMYTTILILCQNGIFLVWSKLKAFADYNITITENLKFVLERVENILGKGENAGYQHFLLFSVCF